jgi:hypothetical protein
MRFPRLPERCPQCNTQLSTLRRPVPHYTKRGMLLLLLIAPTAIVSAGVFALLISVIRVFPRNFYTAGLFLFVSIFPAALVYRQAKLNRVVTLNCRSCGWHDDFYMLPRNYPDLPDDDD